MNKLAPLMARVVFTVFSLVTCLDCLLAYLPFTYQQIHAGHLIPWLDEFARIHPLLNLTMVPLALVPAVSAWRRGGAARWLAGGFAAYELAYAALLTIHPLLTGLENDSTSLLWSLVALGSVAWLAIVDIACYAGQVNWIEKTSPRASAFAAGCGAVFVSLLYAAAYFVRRPAAAALPRETAALGWSLLAHLLLFLGFYLALECVGGLAGLFAAPAAAEFWLIHVLLAAGIGMVLHTVVWPAVGFYGWREIAFSGALGVILASANAGLALCLTAGQSLADGIAAAIAPATLGLARSWRSGMAALLLLAGAGGYLAVRLPALDWNYLLQKLTAVAVWLGSFAGFYAIGARRVRAKSMAWLAAPLLLVVAYRGLEAAASDTAPLLEQWAGYDASFLLARQFLAAPERESGSFYEFLNRNTNIAASVHVDPAPVELVSQLRPSQDPPNLFIFTIDSLRRDYLSPYNPAVQFTPSIASFARESTVFENAFTRYGGTGLSEPAVWSGALLLHKQYITPFAPMNALEKLISAEHYQVLISRDSILQKLLTPSAAAVDLDGPDSTMTLDFARTLATLGQQLKERNPAGPPVFVYTQPQNLHVSVIQREGRSVPRGETYPGLDAPYASRVKRIDAAFGEFIEFLKQRGLYDHSIIVLTADHGDSLGEEGRWGHAYTLFPEIVRIPLIIHVPDSLRSEMSTDPEELAFSTDITPSLYYLLGQRPIQKNELFGTPLFTATAAERRRDPRAEYLLASSYGAVYGILSDGGRRLYVADGVNYRSYLFRLTARGAAAERVDPELEQEETERIRNHILAINRFYGFGGPKGGRP